MLQPVSCPECGSRASSHGHLQRTYVDAPLRGKQVVLQVARMRYRCHGKHTFQQPLDDCVDGKQMTVRALRYIEEQCLRTSLNSISGRMGISDKNVRDVSADFFARLADSRLPARTSRLEILPVALGGCSACVLIDRDTRRILDLLSRDELQSGGASELIGSVCHLDALQSVYDPQGWLVDACFEGLAREALPSAPEVTASLEKIVELSSKVSFAVVRARMQLWSDPLLHADVLVRGFKASCSCCLASCLKGELQEVRIKEAGDHKYLLCTACRGLRAPTWLTQPANR